MSASRCTWCGQAGEPYEYKGTTYDGLTACEGDRLCSGCTDIYLDRAVNEPVGWAQVPARGYVTPRVHHDLGDRRAANERYYEVFYANRDRFASIADGDSAGAA